MSYPITHRKDNLQNISNKMGIVNSRFPSSVSTKPSKREKQKITATCSVYN